MSILFTPRANKSNHVEISKNQMFLRSTWIYCVVSIHKGTCFNTNFVWVWNKRIVYFGMKVNQFIVIPKLSIKTSVSLWSRLCALWSEMKANQFGLLSERLCEWIYEQSSECLSIKCLMPHEICSKQCFFLLLLGYSHQWFTIRMRQSIWNKSFQSDPFLVK